MVTDNNAAPPGDPCSPTSSTSDPAVEPTRRVLVVDDDPDMRHLIFHLLRADGYRVVCAEDGQAGWEALCESGFDAMITDHDMPRLTGLGLIRRVRAGPSRLPVILISGDMPWQDPDLGRLLTPGLAIDKPFRLSEFLVSVRDTFGRALKADLRSGNDGAHACLPSRPPRIVVPIA